MNQQPRHLDRRTLMTTSVALVTCGAVSFSATDVPGASSQRSAHQATPPIGTPASPPADQASALNGTWLLHLIVYPDGRKFATVPDPYTIEFSPDAGDKSVPGPDGRIRYSADCSGGSADYDVAGTRLQIDKLVRTRADCWALSPSRFTRMFENLLQGVTGYTFEEGELVLLVEGGATLSFFPEDGTAQAG